MRNVNLRSLSWRRVKKLAKMHLRRFNPPLEILKREGHIWYVTPHKNHWCSRYWDIVIHNAEILNGLTGDDWWKLNNPNYYDKISVGDTK